MEGHGRSWKVKEVRSGREMVGLEKSQKIMKVMEGHGRSWKVTEGHGRSWKVIEGHGSKVR